MNPIDFIVIGIVALFILGAILLLRRRKKECKNTCAYCPYNGGCSIQKDNQI